MFLRNGRKHARLLSTYYWLQKLSMGYLVLKLHSEVIAGLITSCAEVALQRNGCGMGTGETPKRGWAGLAAAGLMPHNLHATNVYFPFQQPTGTGCITSHLCKGGRVSIWVRHPRKY